MHQFGTGRPDQQDEKELIRFSEQIMQKIETKMECMKVELPGNHNYREYNGVPLKTCCKWQMYFLWNLCKRMSSRSDFKR